MNSPLTQAERDAAYNNGAAVPETPVLTAQRIAASTAWREAHPDHLDIPYGPGQRTKWDLFPARDASAPCLVFIHGGYWQFGAREENAVVARGIAAHGWSVALPGYTLAPEASMTQIVEEVHQALDWLGQHGPSHGIAGPVLLSGWSAGGLLTAMGLSHPLVRAAVAISGVYELGPIRGIYLDEKLRLSDREIDTLSPLRLPPVAKTMSIAYGAEELPALVKNSRDLHGHRQVVDPVGRLISLEGLNHFTLYRELTEPDGLLVKEALRLAGLLAAEAPAFAANREPSSA